MATVESSTILDSRKDAAREVKAVRVLKNAGWKPKDFDRWYDEHGWRSEREVCLALEREADKVQS